MQNQNEIHVNTLWHTLILILYQTLRKVIFLSQITEFQVDVHFNRFDFK